MHMQRETTQPLRAHGKVLLLHMANGAVKYVISPKTSREPPYSDCTHTPLRFNVFFVPVSSCTSAGTMRMRFSLLRPPIRIPDVLSKKLKASADSWNCRKAYPKFWRLLRPGMWKVLYFPLKPRSCMQSKNSSWLHRQGIFLTITVQTPASNGQSFFSLNSDTNRASQDLERTCADTEEFCTCTNVFLTQSPCANVELPLTGPLRLGVTPM